MNYSLTQRKESQGIWYIGERANWFFPLRSLYHMLFGMNPGVDLFDSPQIFFSECGDCSSISTDSLEHPRGLLDTDVQLLLTRDQAAVSLDSSPPCQHSVWTWYQEPSDVSSFRRQRVDSFFALSSLEREVWVDFMYLCSWWKQSLNPSTLGMLGLRKRLVLHPSQAKRWDFLSHLRAHGLPLRRSCYVSTIGFMWLQGKAQWCFSWTFVCDLSLAELDSCPSSFLAQFILHKGK